ncbi:hypothetical protein L596_006537 [Steinernema carpocapsae]|uniref:Uncharacterized protein n=1 Tax=Steinernema carpocapsae TaxID=34508 RepID=A0A4U8V2C7_STECR|nr:hypothetical protein L596_006537 [Steinernema carpocapsae]
MLARRLIPFSCANVSQRQMRVHKPRGFKTDKQEELYLPHHLSAPIKIFQRFKIATAENYSAANTLTNVPNDDQFGETYTALKTVAAETEILGNIKLFYSRNTWLKLLYIRYIVRLNLQEEEVEQGSKIVFEMLFQNMFKNTVQNLTNNTGFHPDVVKNVDDSIKDLSNYQRKLYNITADDIIDVKTAKLDLSTLEIRHIRKEALCSLRRGMARILQASRSSRSR